MAIAPSTNKRLTFLSLFPLRLSFFLQGIKLIGESLTEVSTAIQDCQGAINDVENILKVLKEFKTPMSFAYHVGKVRNKERPESPITHIIIIFSERKDQTYADTHRPPHPTILDLT